MAAGNGGEGHSPEQFDGANGTTTKNGKHPRREYNNVASEASERGQTSAGAAAGEDCHGATEIAESWDEKTQRARLMQKHDEGETEARAPPKRLRALNASGR